MRENLGAVQKGLALRGTEISFEAWLESDRRHRELKSRIEALKHQKNKASDEIARLKREKGPIDSIMQEMKQVGQEIERLEAALKETEEKLGPFLLTLPNLPHASVPVGKDERDNQEIRRWGKAPAFLFKPKPHWELGESL
ncbi:MAG TPA: serine--tRNA ligase, partial [Candidatus Manganitrophaceae bacterium]